MTNTSCNVSFAGFTNFTASFPPAQRIIVGNSSNPLYLRYALMTQDSVQLVYYSASVTIPMDALYQVAFAAQPALTFPPVINVQPSASFQIITAPASASFYLSASSEIPVNYQWWVQPSGSSSWFLPTASIGHYSFQGTSSNAFTASFPVNTLPSWSFECVITSSAGNTTSSVAILYVQ